jgi:hypothetical protein
VHEEMPREVNIIFVGQPLDLGRGGSNPPGPLGPPKCFGLLMNSNKPPLPPSKPYCWPLNYFEYVKDSDPNVHVIVFKVAIRVNGET